MLESPQWGDSNKYPKHMFYEKKRTKQDLSYISICSLSTLYNSKFILMATFLRTNPVVVTTVHCRFTFFLWCFTYHGSGGYMRAKDFFIIIFNIIRLTNLLRHRHWISKQMIWFDENDSLQIKALNLTYRNKSTWCLIQSSESFDGLRRNISSCSK